MQLSKISIFLIAAVILVAGVVAVADYGIGSNATAKAGISTADMHNPAATGYETCPSMLSCDPASKAPAAYESGTCPETRDVCSDERKAECGPPDFCPEGNKADCGPDDCCPEERRADCGPGSDCTPTRDCPTTGGAAESGGKAI